MRRLLGFLYPPSLLHKLRSFRSPIQDDNPINMVQLAQIVVNQEHLLPNNNIDQEQSPPNQEANAQHGDQARHPHAVHELRNDAVPVSLFLLTASIYLLVNHPAGDNSGVLYLLIILYTTSLSITFFLSIGLLLYTITSGAVLTSEEDIRVQSRLMILGLVSLITPLLITTGFTVHIPVLGLAMIWIPLLITVGLCLRLLSEANRLLR